MGLDKKAIEDHFTYLWNVLNATPPFKIDIPKMTIAVCELLDNIPYPITRVPPLIYNFYRVRQGEPDKFFYYTSDFGIPPISEEIHQGRCNSKGSQALYFAVTEETALYEACNVRRSRSSEFHLAYIGYFGAS